MKKVVDVKKITNNKFINIYNVKYQTETGEVNYEIATRRKSEQEMAVMGNKKADAVRILPYIKKDNEIYVVLIKEFRYPVNDYIYSIPAGIIDEGESPAKAAYRELKEEIGATIKRLTQTTNINYISAGMSDESVICFEAEVQSLARQHLEKSEDIEVKLVTIDELNKMLASENFGAQSIFQLKAFTIKYELEKLKQENKKLKEQLNKNNIDLQNKINL